MVQFSVSMPSPQLLGQRVENIVLWAGFLSLSWLSWEKLYKVICQTQGYCHTCQSFNELHFCKKSMLSDKNSGIFGLSIFKPDTYST